MSAGSAQAVAGGARGGRRLAGWLATDDADEGREVRSTAGRVGFAIAVESVHATISTRLETAG